MYENGVAAPCGEIPLTADDMSNCVIVMEIITIVMESVEEQVMCGICDGPQMSL